ncbi:MAG: PD40 domain-containing protein [Flammeovirgaceae bacterium]|nr:PD40 domain-containing protein [Flammeovirgaceae bacterium]
MKLNLETGNRTLIHREETAWRTKPDLSPDGTRLVYSSYLGRNWNQLWMLPANGGYAMQLTYGEYDNALPRWSPDGEKDCLHFQS